jgi:hypothetical protein
VALWYHSHHIFCSAQATVFQTLLPCVPATGGKQADQGSAHLQGTALLQVLHARSLICKWHSGTAWWLWVGHCTGWLQSRGLAKGFKTWMLTAEQLCCAEVATAAAEEDGYSSDDEATATPVSSTAVLTALSGAISEADLGRAAGADARASQRAASAGGGRAGSISAVEDEGASASEAAASGTAADWQAGAGGGAAKKKRNRKQRYKDNLVKMQQCLSFFSWGFCCMICSPCRSETGVCTLSQYPIP